MTPMARTLMCSPRTSRPRFEPTHAEAVPNSNAERAVGSRRLDPTGLAQRRKQDREHRAAASRAIFSVSAVSTRACSSTRVRVARLEPSSLRSIALGSVFCPWLGVIVLARASVRLRASPPIQGNPASPSTRSSEAGSGGREGSDRSRSTSGSSAIFGGGGSRSVWIGYCTGLRPRMRAREGAGAVLRGPAQRLGHGPLDATLRDLARREQRVEVTPPHSPRVPCGRCADRRARPGPAGAQHRGTLSFGMLLSEVRRSDADTNGTAATAPFAGATPSAKVRGPTPRASHA